MPACLPEYLTISEPQKGKLPDTRSTVLHKYDTPEHSTFVCTLKTFSELKNCEGLIRSGQVGKGMFLTDL